MIYLQDPDVTIHQGDALELLRGMPSGSVHMACTSPPFYGLRDYGMEGQIGLEATPDEWVARLVDVFRELRRVLRDDGTFWLEIGDSYAGSWGAQSRENGSGAESLSATQIAAHPAGTRTGSIPPGAPFKPKDLIGAPWLLAEALKAPYYTGTIGDERDRIWLAAIIDGEGSISVNRLRASEKNDRTRDSFGPYLRVHNTSEAIIRRCAQITGAGSVKTHDTRGRPVHVWAVYGNTARQILREVYPHLTAKKHEARLAYGCSESNGVSCWAGLKSLHRGVTPEADCPPPPSLFEPGWYLRSEIIWAKPNPMPESVSDRPTQSHSRVFLLTKQKRYFMDMEAIREPNSDTTIAMWGESHQRQGAPGSAPDRNDYDASTNGATTCGVNPAGRNRRSVWTIPTQPYPEAHFATWPEKLVEPMILAGTSEHGVCSECGAPWERVVDTTYEDGGAGGPASRKKGDSRRDPGRNDYAYETRKTRVNTTIGWQPTCTCTDWTATDHPVPFAVMPTTILDPFGGSGTTALVARKHGRRAILLELNTDYCRLAAERLSMPVELLPDAPAERAFQLSLMAGPDA